MKWVRPGKDEYGEFYAPYVERAGEGDPVASMAAQIEEIEALAQLGDARAAESPSAGEWSAKEVLGHLCDFERVFAYRALRFSRGDEAPLHSFDQDDYVAMAGSNRRPLADLISEFVHLRRAMVMHVRRHGRGDGFSPRDGERERDVGAGGGVRDTRTHVDASRHTTA